VPRQDAQGRWISDDGRSYWDGVAWRPLGVMSAAGAAELPAQARAKSPWPVILIGCGIVALVVIVIGVVGVFAVISNPGFQRTVCNSYTANDPNLVCPFSPASP
jgi:hypothetical protein